MIEITNLRKRFGRSVAVDDVSLTIADGDSVALWGVNGAGKTTIIRCVLGLLRFQGTIRVGGLDVRRDGKRARRLIGYVPQELGFYDDLGVAEAIGYFGLLKGLKVRDADHVLDAVGLASHEGKRIRELSGGMKQRLALAIALLGSPPVLVLDEVTASLDACGREEFVSLLERLSHAGKTILFASHRADEVVTLANRVILLEKGRVTGESPAAEFMTTLGHEATLHLHIRSGLRERALAALGEFGLDARLNGIGVLVSVAPGQKSAPFRVLNDARIAVEDFELLASMHPRRQTKEATP